MGVKVCDALFVSVLVAVWDLENIMTFAFSGFSFILHLAHHQGQGPSADIPPLNRYFYSWPIGLCHLQIATC